MAKALVYIELSAGAATRPSLRALNEGRRLATRFGATLYAVVPCATPPGYGEDDIVAVLSRHGADKVVLVTNPQLSMPTLYATHASALHTACDQFPPQLVLLPASLGGQDIGPRLALDLDGYFAGDVRIEATDDESEVLFSRWVFRRQLRGAQPLAEAGRPLVLTLAEDDVLPLEMGIDEAEVVVVQAPTNERAGVQVTSVEDGTGTQPLVLGAGAGVDDQAYGALERLAAALGAPLVTTAEAHAKGLGRAPDGGARPILGFDGCSIDADTYLAFGISGSERHLAGLDARTRVIAVNSDPAAPIFDVAFAGLVGDAKEVAEALLAELAQAAEPDGDAVATEDGAESEGSK